MLGLLFHSSFSFAQFKRTLDFGKVNPDPIVIDQITFPRTKDIKYRGTSEVQMDRFKMMEAMLGLETHMESILFSGVKLMLMGKDVPFKAAINNTITSRGLENRIAEVLGKYNGQFLSEEDAKKEAFSIIESDLLGRYSSKDLSNHYYNYLSPEYELFPQELIFSTIYLEVANIYSRFITLIEEDKSEMLDLNYWNMVNNKAWTFTASKWVDKGEFVIPIVLEAKKIVGYFEYHSQVPDYKVFRPLPNELDLAFFKTSVNGENLILVFDGQVGPRQYAKAMVKVSDNKYTYADSRFDPTAEIPLNLKSNGNSGNIMAVIKLCPKDLVCTLNHSLLGHNKRSKRQLPADWENRISKIVSGKKHAKIFYANGSIDSKSIKTFPVPEVLPNSKVLLEKLKDNDSSNYSKSLVADAPKISTKVLSYNLKSNKLNSKEALYLSVPENYRSLVVKSVRLKQFQDPSDNSTPLRGKWDDSPAYSSVQLYSLDSDLAERWRYSPLSSRHSIPLGALYADLKTADQSSFQNLDNWKATLGVSDQMTTTGELKIGAIRIINVGIDPATLQEIEVLFE